MLVEDTSSITFVDGVWKVKTSKGSLLPGAFTSQLRAAKGLRRYQIQSQEAKAVKKIKKEK